MKVLVLVINVALAYTAVPLRLDGYTSSMGMVVVSSSEFPHRPRRLARFGTFFSLLLMIDAENDYQLLRGCFYE